MQMYQCGDMVVYGIHGVCRIAGVEEQVIDRKRVEYYILEPTDQTGARFYVPIGNAAALSKLSPMLTAQELNSLLKSEQVQSDAWIPDEAQRKQRYRKLINSGDRGALVSMVHSLHKQRIYLRENGKKFHQCDENFLRDAQKLLDAEFSLVLKIPQEKVEQYVLEMMEAK